MKSAAPAAWRLALFPTLLAIIAIGAGTLLAGRAYLQPRGGGIDEISLFNPAYTKLHTGRLAYPAYVQPEAMFIHPPIHTGIVGTLLTFGLPLYWAEAADSLALLLLAILLVAFSGFPYPMRLGLILALYASFCSLPLDWFGMRPEASLMGAWVSGLVLLESGIRCDWSRARLFAGSFLLTCAAGIHYYAAPALLGFLPVAILAFRHPDRRIARRGLAAAAAGSLAFGLPYMAFFVVPNLENIRHAVSDSNGFRGTLAALRVHKELYSFVLQQPLSRNSIFHWIGSTSFAIPFVLLSLLSLTNYRRFVLLAIPVPLFVWLGISHKLSSYLNHELFLFFGILFALLFQLAGWIGERLRSGLVSGSIIALLSLGTLGAFASTSGDWNLLRRFRVPPFHDLDMARAAGLQMMGPAATIGYRLSFWYVGGESRWYMIDPDIHWSDLPIRFEPYFRILDAIAVNRHFSDETQSKRRLTSSRLYARGDAQLRGFYWSIDDPGFSYWLLAGQAPSVLQGFVMDNYQLHRFQQDPRGDYELISAICPDAARENLSASARWSHSLNLPKPTPKSEHQEVVAVLRKAVGSPPLPPACRLRDRIHGSVTDLDWRPLLRKLKNQDQPIRFYNNLSDLAGSKGELELERIYGEPSPNAVRIPGAFPLSESRLPNPDSRILSRQPLRVFVPTGDGQYGVAVPKGSGVQPQGMCWVDARLRIERGRVGIAAWVQGSSDMTAEPSPLVAANFTRRLRFSIDRCESFDSVLFRGASKKGPTVFEVVQVDLWSEPSPMAGNPASH